MMCFTQVMSVYLSWWQKGVQNMLLNVQNTNEKRLVGKFEQFINRWFAWIAVVESLSAILEKTWKVASYEMLAKLSIGKLENWLKDRVQNVVWFCMHEFTEICS